MVGRCSNSIMSSKKSQLAIILFLLAPLACLSSIEYSIMENGLNDFLPEERVVEVFQQWRRKFQKVYNIAGEEENRLENFRTNLKYVIEKNSNRKSNSEHKVGLNKFADMSSEEFQERLVSRMQKPRIPWTWSILSVNNKFGNWKKYDAPPSFDWRKKMVVTPVKDNRDCERRRVISLTGVIEWISAMASGEDLVLWEQERSMNCDKTNSGPDEDNDDHNDQSEIDTSRTIYRYMDSKIGEMKLDEAPLKGYQEMGKKNGLLMCAAVQSPINVVMDASAMDFQLYTGGIYNGDCSDNPEDVNHVVLVVGFGSEDGEDYWIMQNSWGKEWGMEGYFHIKRSSDLPYGTCGINTAINYHSDEFLHPRNSLLLSLEVLPPSTLMPISFLPPPPSSLSLPPPAFSSSLPSSPESISPSPPSSPLLPPPPELVSPPPPLSPLALPTMPPPPESISPPLPSSSPSPPSPPTITPPPQSISPTPPPELVSPPPPSFSPLTPPPTSFSQSPPPPTTMSPPPESISPPPPTAMPPPSPSSPLLPPSPKLISPPPPYSFASPPPLIINPPPPISISPPPPSTLPPPSPSPTECGEFSYCSSTETCCCFYEFYGVCLIYGCCPYTDAVCCARSKLCCPKDYPICHVEEKLCLKSNGDYLGVASTRRHIATHKLPWIKSESKEQTHQHLQWKWKRIAAMR